MSNLSELELQNLRHLIGGYETSHCKMNAYAQQSQDGKAVFCEGSTICNAE